MLRRVFALTCFITAAPLTPAIEIALRYDYDDSGFFDQPGARAAMRQCADFFESILTDSLSRIEAGRRNTWNARFQDPETGASVQLVDFVVPKDTVIIFLGSRNLGGSTTGQASTGYGATGTQAFFDLIVGRGQDGALSSPPTDYSPWGGSITFDTHDQSGEVRIWNFSTTSTDGPGVDFVGVALHELCHIFGIGASDSWNDWADTDLIFDGPASSVANNGQAPHLQQGKGHWAPTAPGPYQSKAFGSFGTPHGQAQQVLMNPSSTSGADSHRVLTDLDLAGLIDIGWELVLPLESFAIVSSSPANPAFSFATNSNFTYRIQRGNLFTPFVNLSPAIAGDGTVKSFTDENPPALKAFYRLAVSRNQQPTPFAKMAPVENDQQGSISWSWVSVGCCPHE